MLAVGGDLDARRLILAYAHGIFPWFDRPPVLWFSPDPRFVLDLSELRVPRSTRKHLRRVTYRCTMDTAFDEVIARCARAPRPGQDGTWIGEGMESAYRRLHRLGVAHSVEAWSGDELVGGLYGVALGGLYCGESMFTRAPDASKVAFSLLCAQLTRWGYPWVDSQAYTDHLARFGARDIPRETYLERLPDLLALPGRAGRWSFDDDLAADLVG